MLEPQPLCEAQVDGTFAGLQTAGKDDRQEEQGGQDERSKAEAGFRTMSVA